MSPLTGEWPIRVYYEDTDHSGAVYYANYLRFFERGRTELLRSLGFEPDLLAQRERVLFVVYRIGVDYRRPALFNDVLRIVTRVDGLGRTWIEFHQTVYREGESVPLSCGWVVVACVEPEGFRPIRIPAALQRALEVP